MTPSPKLPNEKNLREDPSSSSDDFSHPSFHHHHESIATTDESTSSSDEENPINGYSLLPQESNSSFLQRSDPIEQKKNENIDEQFDRFVRHRLESSSTEDISPSSTFNSSNCSIESIWSSETFLLDDKKADYIKTFMSTIKLPESSVPLWAQTSSEQDWNEKLRQRFFSHPTTFFFAQKT